MKRTKLSIGLTIPYQMFALPHPIALPVEPGKVGIWSYRQNASDPLRIVGINVTYAPTNRIKLTADLAGSLEVDNFPDPGFYGTTVRAEAGLTVSDGEVRIREPAIEQLDLAQVPDFIDQLIRKAVNRHLLGELEREIRIDLRPVLEDARARLNQPIPLRIKFAGYAAGYALTLGAEPFSVAVKTTKSGIALRLALDFAPLVTGAA